MEIYSKTLIDDGVPHHIVMRRVAGVLSLAIDGNVDGTAPAMSDLGALAPILIGQQCDLGVAMGVTVANVCLSVDVGSARDAATITDMAADGSGVSDLSALNPSVPDLSVPDLFVACGVCSPGQQQTIPCGNCGMETDTCTTSCQWAAGPCGGQGACAPNATMGCGSCGTSTCGNNCQWGSCNGQGTCAAGAAQYCGGGCPSGTHMYQTCTTSCTWGACGC